MIITLHSDVYPIETIQQTCYQFIEQAYFHIDLDGPGKRVKVKVSFKKEGPKKVLPKEFRGKFLEELLYASLRYSINQRNLKLREYIVGSALFAHKPSEAAVTPPEHVLDDPLGIAVPWEQSHGKK